MGAGLLLALVTPAASLRAAAPAAGRVVRLTYTRASGAEVCPDQDEIERQVRARLGYEPFAADAVSALSATIRPAGRGLRAHVELRGEGGKVEGQRDLDSPGGDCTELAASLAFALSMAIDPLAAVRPPPSSPPPRPSTGSPRSPTDPPRSPADPPRPASSPPRPLAPRPPAASSSSAASSSAPPASSAPAPVRRPDLSVSFGALIVSGLVPDLSPGLALGFDARLGWASLGLEASFVSSRLNVSDERGVTSSIAAGALVPCAHVRRLFGCGVGMVGTLQSKDFGVESSQGRRSLFAAAGGRVGVQIVPEEPLWVRLSGELLVNLTPITLTVDDQPVWSPPLLSGVALLTLGLSF